MLCVFPVCAQTALTRGGIAGVVTDGTGAAVMGARVLASTAEGSQAAQAATAADGTFALRDLASGTYAVQVTAAGFAPFRGEGVAVAVGREARIEVRLQPEQASAEVTVSAGAETLDVTQPSPATNIDRDRIEELPIPSRNYLNFTLLAPSLMQANPAGQTAGAQEGGFSAAGLRPSSNALYIDGAENNDEYTGMSRTQLSPEAINDFQVVNHGYAAQYGGGAGGAVVVETRAGADLQHGDAFIFMQNGSLNATPPLERAPHKPDETRMRAGLATGGAWKATGLYYYAAAEQESAHGQEASDLSAARIAAIESALVAGPLRGFQLRQGFFPTTEQETEISARADRTFGRTSAMLRYAMTNSRRVNDAFHREELADVSARGSAFTLDHSATGAFSTTFSPQLINQLSLEWARRRLQSSTGSQSGPGIIVAGTAEFGTPLEGNERRVETHAGVADDLIAQRGKHLLGVGVAANAVLLRAANRDGFGGLYVFPTMSALANAAPDFYMQSFGAPNTNFVEFRMGTYAQDRWSAARNLTLEFGARWEWNRLPGNLPQDPINIAPRMGFAWSGGKQWVVRGGFGMYYDRWLLSTVNRLQEFDGRGALMQVAEGVDAAALYRAGAVFAQPHAGIAPSIWRSQRKLRNPYAETASLGVERALPGRWTAGAEFRHVHGVRLGRTVNDNLLPPVTLTAANAASLGVTDPTPQQIERPVFGPGRRDPAYDAVYRFQTQAASRYDGATFTANRQFTEDVELMVGYTFSKTLDDFSFDTEMLQNPYAPAAERARSLQDQRHRFVLSGLWVLGPDLDEPGDRAAAAKPTRAESLLYGLEFAPILEVHSGFMQNPLTGVDSNREHVYPFAARPLGIGRNSITEPVAVNFDMRVLKMVSIGRGRLDLVAESFNLLNRQDVHMLNAVYGSGAAPVAEFGRPMHAGDARRVQFSIDYEY